MENKESGLRTQPKQSRAKLRIKQILDAAADVFAEHGYDVSTTNEIARRADTSIGAVYRFFPDKRAIFVALSQRYLEKVSRIFADEISPKLSLEPPELAEYVLDVCDSFFGSEPAFGAVFVYADASAELKDIDREMKRTVSQLIAVLLARKNTLLTKAQCELIGRVCVEVSAAYFRLCLSEAEMPHDQRKAAFKELISAYLGIYFQKG